jgi:predicted flavoprotein YhiN
VEGKPLQNIRARAGSEVAIGEAMLTHYGIQGTVLYALGRALRSIDQPAIHIDFKPTFTVERLTQKMESARRNFLQEAAARWKLPDAAAAILEQWHGPFTSAEELAIATKDCRIPLTRPRPLAEAISSAGGVAWSELDASLMLRNITGVFCAGEMIDWEAPTGGFLLQACFATGSIAGQSATAFLAADPREQLKDPDVTTE